MQDLIRKIKELENQIEAMRTIEIPGGWKSWTPNHAGFSTAPSGNYLYKVANGMCFVFYDDTISGTSNATTFTVAAPLPANTLTSEYTNGIGWYRDNSVFSRGIGYVRILTSSPSVIQLSHANGPASWTAANLKEAHFQFVYGI